MDKPAPTEHDVHDLIRQRWSPRAFSSRSVEKATVQSLLEAARWAPSSFNEQPWQFIVAERRNGREFERMLSCLVESNQLWAKNAQVLMLSVAKKAFDRNGKANRHAFHDVGQAVAQLALQATTLGLGVHQMAGFSQEAARELYAIPESHEAVAAIAIGYPGNPDTLPEKLRDLEHAERSRRPQDEFAFTGTWGRAHSKG